MNKKLGFSFLLVGAATLLVSCGDKKSSETYSHNSSHDSYCQIAWPEDIWNVDPSVDEYIVENAGTKTVQYSKTTDTELVLDKDYYEKRSDNSYLRVVNPKKAELANYYEIGDVSNLELFFELLQKNDWVPNELNFVHEEVIDYGIPEVVDYYKNDNDNIIIDGLRKIIEGKEQLRRLLIW